jgi:hypothetical protein
LVLLLFLIVFETGETTVIKSIAQPSSWVDSPVIGDAFRIEFYRDKLSGIKQDYRLSALYNTVSAWIDYRSWMQYPDEWNNIANLISISHQNGLPVGISTGYHAGDSVDAPYADPVGFLYYYQHVLPSSQWWRFPNGTVASDPYSVGLSRSFTGAYVVRFLGEELGRRDLIGVMQPQNPYWQSFFVNWAKTAISKGADAFFFDSQDAMLVYNYGGGWGCADTWEGYGFINYLKARYTPSQLSSLGITSIDTFCLRDYLKAHYQFNGVSSNYVYVREKFKVSWPTETALFSDPGAVMHDPLMREAVVYWYRSMVDFTRESMRQIKEYAASIGKQVILASNNYFSWPQYLMVVPYMDAVYVETSQFSSPPYQTNPALCKLAQASGNFSKRVWTGEWLLQFSNPFIPDSPPADISTLIKLKIAEGYGDGCKMLVPFGTGNPADGWPPRRLVLGTERGPVSKYYQFISDYKELFANTQPYSKVAVIESLPTQMWNNIPALGVRNWQDENEAFGWTRAVESMHIPYDVLLLGLDGVLSTDSISRLANYDLIIAPGLTNVSAKDLDALRSYLSIGGKLIVSNDLGTNDELNTARDPSTISDILTNPNTAVVNSGLGRTYIVSLQNRNPDTSTLHSMQSVISNKLSDRLVTTDAPQNVFLNTLIQWDQRIPPQENDRIQIQGNRRILIHLINFNYGYDATKDWTQPAGPIQLNVTLPGNRTVSDVVLLTPDPQSQTRFKYTLNDNHLGLTIPNLDTWSIVAVGLSDPSTPKISLKPGWNLISLPLIPENSAITRILRYQIAANEVAVVWSYTGTPRSWKYFIPGKTSTLSTMVDGDAYWIYMRAVDTLYVDGYVITPVKTPPSYSLVTGWNLVGFKPQPSVANETVGAYLTSIADSYDSNNVWILDNSSGNWIRATDSTWIRPGDAMWILVVTSATLRP